MSPTGSLSTPQRPSWLKARSPRPYRGPVDAGALAGMRLPDTPGDRIAPTKSWFNIGFHRGLVLSGAFHLLILSVFSVMVLQRPTRTEVVVESSFGRESDVAGLDLTDNFIQDYEVSGRRAITTEFADVSDAIDASPLLFDSMERIEGAIGVKGADSLGTRKIGGMAGNIPVPATAVSKGSFTVWTDPEDPAPGRKYDIVIQVNLPDSIRSYKLHDLTGSVRGTDGYSKAIKYDSTARRGVENGVAQVRVPIPGAAVRVRDTIKIHSTVLREEQTIEIMF